MLPDIEELRKLILEGRISDRGVAFLKNLEGCYLFVYDDKVRPAVPWKMGDKVKGTLTIGVGHAIFSQAVLEKYIQGITMAEADALLQADLAGTIKEVDSRKFPFRNTGERDATVIAAFNCPSMLNESFGTYLKQGRHELAASRMPLYNKSKGAIMEGLITRRSREMVFFLTGVIV